MNFLKLEFSPKKQNRTIFIKKLTGELHAIPGSHNTVFDRNSLPFPLKARISNDVHVAQNTSQNTRATTRLSHATQFRREEDTGTVFRVN